MTKIKVLDASGPPGLPTLLSGASETAVTTVISALSFSPDGEVHFLLCRPYNYIGGHNFCLVLALNALSSNFFFLLLSACGFILHILHK